MIYLDNAATTYPKPVEVYNEMDRVNREAAVNAGRGSYKAARNISELILETKQQIRSLIRADISKAVVFSPSVTIAINQIVHGLAMRERAVVYVSPYEHNAVVRSIYHLSKTKKLKIKELPINTETLEIDLEKMKYEFSKEKPEYVFCTHVSNVTGYILPVEDIFAEAKRYGSVTVLDSAQSMGLIEIRVDLLNADIIAFAGHKTLYGPLGIGGFINVSGISLETFITGGTGSDSLNLEMPNGAEAKYEAASSNVVAIAGLNAALKVLNQKKILDHEKNLTQYLIHELSKNKMIKVFTFNSPEKQVGIVSFVLEGMHAEDVGMILDEDFDIAVRTGYHCAPFIHKYLKDEKTNGTIRIGLGQFCTERDVDKLIVALKDI